MSRGRSAWPHLLAVSAAGGDVDAYRPLFIAAAEAGVRVGWLRWTPDARPSAMADDLESAAAFGALRAVAVEDGRAVAIKPRRGAPVLGDVLREHFRGCALVLIDRFGAETELPAEDAELLSRDNVAWVRVEGASLVIATTDTATETTPDMASRNGKAFDPATLVAALRTPRPW